MSVGKFFKNVGHSVSKGSKSIKHVVSHTEHNISHSMKTAGHNISKGVSTIYKDGKSAVSFAGKHLINDVDNLSSALSSPIIWIAVGGVILVILLKK